MPSFPTQALSCSGDKGQRKTSISALSAPSFTYVFIPFQMRFVNILFHFLRCCDIIIMDICKEPRTVPAAQISEVILWMKR